MNNEYKQAVTQSISTCPIWREQAVEKIGKMIGENTRANAILEKIARTAQSNAIKGGFAAETFHAETFNLDAILNDKDVRAFTDAFANSPLPKNDQLNDIVIMKGGEQVLGAQLKYFKDADATHKAFRSTKDGVHRYEHSDVFLGPSDQIEGIRISADRAALKNQETRPQVASAAGQVRDKTAGQIEADGVKSTPFGKKESEHLGSGSEAGKEMHGKVQTDYLNRATVQQSLRAAKSAAVITAVTAGCINSFQCIKQVREGKMSVEQAIRYILQETVIAAGDSALKAGAATASVAMATRAMPALFTGGTFQSTFAGGAVAGATVCVVDAVQCIVLFAAGSMSLEELETRTGKNVLQTGAAVAGSAVGAAIGAVGGPVGAFVGSLVGGMVTSLAMSIAIDNHVEKNFRLTLAATEQITGNGMAARDALDYLRVSQEYYADFHKGLYLSERHFARQVTTLQAQSVRLKDKINKL